ncbi:class II aaRS and biotin synthetase [Polychaeton citri CBS 116435]|uniref:Class II aaRS and biotin synthetase n=1 Tax=Polychaeton citri CBS 116435 TaxID=1314669 RepID=A0A9P4UTB5_9PEZI|nr:class II aaRS and biotin synthetase [Polychaeton citri CBS 116435]
MAATTNNKRLNVLVYAGNGATTSSVAHATWSLRRLLGPNYAVLTVNGDQILKEPWMATCALLVLPGGADLAYCRTLNGAGNRRIKQYVQNGGSFLGFCAGGYYGCAKCEFEVGSPDKGMEVIGDRELAFFPGVCRGLAFKGFRYQSEAGAKAVKLAIENESFGSGVLLPEMFKAYYNGGGVFVDADKLHDKAIEVLARFEDEVAVDPGEGKAAAVVFSKVGDGRVVLTGPHPEFSAHNLNRHDPTNADYPSLVASLLADEQARMDFMKAVLTKLGLTVSQEVTPVPSLSPLHLSAAKGDDIAELVQSWSEQGILSRDGGGREYIKGENDTFILEPAGDEKWSMAGIAQAVKETLPKAVQESSEPEEKQANIQIANSTPLLGSDTAPKHLIAHEQALPESKETPHFNHHAYFSNLAHFHSLQRAESTIYGKYLLYGEVVTSTQTLIEKNTSLLSHLPTGFTATATTQTAGRGRGTNVWVSPPGTLMFSTVLRHALALSTSAPVTFIQYIAALAIVEGIKGYDNGFQKMPVKLKWPNDIYALEPGVKEERYVKIGGILVNSSYSGGDYTLTLGVGLNATNAAPTTSLSQLLSHFLPQQSAKTQIAPERLLAAILTHFSILYTRFKRTGFDAVFEKKYYEYWLHSEQIVTLENEGGARARVKGISRDWGLLVVEELGWQDRPTGKRWELQSDANSFDFFRGLVRSKR